jgi:hypothetical protein
MSSTKALNLKGVRPTRANAFISSAFFWTHDQRFWQKLFSKEISKLLGHEFQAGRLRGCGLAGIRENSCDS